VLRIALWLVLLPLAAQAQPLRLVLPTDNRALLDGDGPGFYMFTDRNFEGVRSTPWQGGQYGFVRNQERVGPSVVFTRFHEGLDIQPTRRDARGEPLDDVRSIDEGRVAYVSQNAGASSYGRYVVIEHWWQGAPYYSLYAHLARADVRAGQEVGRGETIGRLGYTGAGIDRRRAHLHFEINLYLSDLFDSWYAANYRGANRHGRYHGLNLAGVDAAALLLAHDRDPNLIVGEVIQQTPVAYTVRVPGGYVPEIVRRYPWLAPEASRAAPPFAWDVDVAQSGLPLAFRAAAEAVERPRVLSVADAVRDYGYSTNRMIARSRGEGGGFVLTERGRAHLRLITMPRAGEPQGRW
jgi:murein DD-endopeptidase MepM/ murein hydrolase activator NlpD